MSAMFITRVLMILSMVACGHLLWSLYSHGLRRVYGEATSWRFIFAGYLLLFIEICVGVGILFSYSAVGRGEVGFGAIMLAKVICYDVGFELWSRKRRRILQPGWWESRSGSTRGTDPPGSP